MEHFPDYLTPDRVFEFQILLQQHELSKLRQRVWHYILSGDKGGFDLRSNNQYGKYSYDTVDQQMVDIIIYELEEKGWKTLKGYGDTVLYIWDPITSKAPEVPDAEKFE